MSGTVPSFAEFAAACRKEFAFLGDEFGFSEEPLPQGRRVGSCIELPDGRFINAFAVWFRNGPLRIVVEGIAWGESANLCLGNTEGDLVGLRKLIAQDCWHVPESPAAGGGQLEEVRNLAQILRWNLASLLSGDRAVLVEALRIRREARLEFTRKDAR